MKLDTVLTVAIGDMDSKGQKLTPTEWSDFRSDMRQVLDQYGTVVAEAVGDGVGSDGDNEGVTESTCVFIVINAHVTGHNVRAHVAQVIRAYGQTSACFAFDRAHEPVFNTRDGNRPLTLDDVIDQATEAGLID